VSEDVRAAIQAKSEMLSKWRKKRPLPEGVPAPPQLGEWVVKHNYTLHKTDKPGILSMDILPADQNLVVTGGLDKEAIVFNRATEQVGAYTFPCVEAWTHSVLCRVLQQVVSKLRGHTKKVTTTIFHPQPDHEGLIITG
jgi:pre-mRNA-processing factor 19